MSELIQDPALERELRRFHPSEPPAELMNRLAAPPPRANAPVPRIQEPRPAANWARVLIRILVPASAAALVVGIAAVLWRGRPAEVPFKTVDEAELVADHVNIDSELVASFEAVAELPGGEPVRVRCREWVDNVVVRDEARGVTIQQHKPRMEVVPVRFETY